jgi:NAD(P)-dependent dehydrogenase (short-subunit alcohol dehydrogenase family)
MLLKGKVAIVTGAGRGIGRAIAGALAEEGARVVIADVDARTADIAAEEITQPGIECCAHQIDLRNLDEIPGLINRTLKMFGQLDILVNNAGVEFGGTFFEITPAVWDAHFDINLRAMFFLTQAAAARMREQAGGAVVNVASVQGAIFSGRFVPYTASKSGVRGLTASSAVALAPYKIRVNAVAPGWCDTAMNKIAADPEAIASRLALVPLGRVGQPFDIARAVTFLVSDHASYITGQVLTVDGGRTLGAPPEPAFAQAGAHP